MSTRQNLLTLALSFLLVASGVTRASASVLFDSGGFEPPAYSTTYNPGGGYNGQLEDQPLADALFFRQSGPNQNTATVIANTVGGNGAQVVELHRTNTPDTRWGVLTPVTPTSVTVSWRMMVLPTTVPPGDGPFFGAETYALPGGGFSVLGTLGVDASTGSIMVQAPQIGTTGGDLIAIPATLGLGFAWNNFSLVLNYATQSYAAFVNSLPVYAGAFVDTNNNGPFSSFNDADLSGLQTTTAGASSVGTAYYDDFKVEAEGAVPEPASLLVWGLGTLLITAIYWTRSSRKSA